jgi:zinc transport system substrate-binding protein
MRNIIFVFIIVAFIVSLIGMQKNNKASKNKINNRPIISLSTFSLYDIAKNISGNTFELVMIMPFGVDAHSFEPTPKLMIKIYKSNLVVYSGAGLEPWIDRFEFKGASIDMSKHVSLRKLTSPHHHKQISEQEKHHLDETYFGYDPHYWLDIDNMISATTLMSEEFIKISPKNRELYVKNRDLYIAKLKKLESDYKQKLSTCQSDTIIVNHNAFSYIANKYGFRVEALSGLSPEAEPSPKNMVRLIEHIKEHNISTIFFESFVSDRAIKSIASEAHVNVDVLQPLANITANDAKENLSFEDIMRKNLTKITKALNCQ